jgi:hypothetical protein
MIEAWRRGHKATLERAYGASYAGFQILPGAACPASSGMTAFNIRFFQPSTTPKEKGPHGALPKFGVTAMALGHTLMMDGLRMRAGQPRARRDAPSDGVPSVKRFDAAAGRPAHTQSGRGRFVRLVRRKALKTRTVSGGLAPARRTKRRRVMNPSIMSV